MFLLVYIRSEFLCFLLLITLGLSSWFLQVSWSPANGSLFFPPTDTDYISEEEKQKVEQMLAFLTEESKQAAASTAVSSPAGPTPPVAVLDTRELRWACPLLRWACPLLRWACPLLVAPPSFPFLPCCSYKDVK